MTPTELVELRLANMDARIALLRRQAEDATLLREEVERQRTSLENEVLNQLP